MVNSNEEISEERRGTRVVNLEMMVLVRMGEEEGGASIEEEEMYLINKLTDLDKLCHSKHPFGKN